MYSLLAAMIDTFAGLMCIIVAIIAVYTYTYGELYHSRIAYPKLWRLGISFSILRGLFHFANALAELHLTVLNLSILLIAKFLTASIGAWFAIEFWATRGDIILIGNVLHAVEKNR